MAVFLMDGYLIALQKGDERAFRVLFNKYYASLCLFAESFLKDNEAAADIVQETFIKYWAKHADFDNSYKIRSFLYVVTRHTCLNYLRDHQLRVDISECEKIESDDFFEKKIIEEEAYRLFYAAIEELPSQMRKVIYYALDGLRNGEIAREMNISEHAVHAYKKEAYKRLREKMKDCYFFWECVVFLFLDGLK